MNSLVKVLRESPRTMDTKSVIVLSVGLGILATTLAIRHVQNRGDHRANGSAEKDPVPNATQSESSNSNTNSNESTRLITSNRGSDIGEGESFSEMPEESIVLDPEVSPIARAILFPGSIVDSEFISSNINIWLLSIHENRGFAFLTFTAFFLSIVSFVVSQAHGLYIAELYHPAQRVLDLPSEAAVADEDIFTIDWLLLLGPFFLGIVFSSFQWPDVNGQDCAFLQTLGLRADSCKSTTNITSEENSAPSSYPQNTPQHDGETHQQRVFDQSLNVETVNCEGYESKAPHQSSMTPLRTSMAHYFLLYSTFEASDIAKPTKPSSCVNAVDKWLRPYAAAIRFISQHLQTRNNDTIPSPSRAVIQSYNKFTVDRLARVRLLGRMDAESIGSDCSHDSPSSDPLPFSSLSDTQVPNFAPLNLNSRNGSASDVVDPSSLTFGVEGTAPEPAIESGSEEPLNPIPEIPAPALIIRKPMVPITDIVSIPTSEDNNIPVHRNETLAPPRILQLQRAMQVEVKGTNPSSPTASSDQTEALVPQSKAMCPVPSKLRTRQFFSLNPLPHVDILEHYVKSPLFTTVSLISHYDPSRMFSVAILRPIVCPQSAPSNGSGIPPLRLSLSDNSSLARIDTDPLFPVQGEDFNGQLSDFDVSKQSPTNSSRIHYENIMQFTGKEKSHTPISLDENIVYGLAQLLVLIDLAEENNMPLQAESWLREGLLVLEQLFIERSAVSKTLEDEFVKSQRSNASSNERSPIILEDSFANVLNDIMHREAPETFACVLQFLLVIIQQSIQSLTIGTLPLHSINRRIKLAMNIYSRGPESGMASHSKHHHALSSHVVSSNPLNSTPLDPQQEILSREYEQESFEKLCTNMGNDFKFDEFAKLGSNASASTTSSPIHAFPHPLCHLKHLIPPFIASSLFQTPSRSNMEMAYCNPCHISFVVAQESLVQTFFPKLHKLCSAYYWRLGRSLLRKANAMKMHPGHVYTRYAMDEPLLSLPMRRISHRHTVLYDPVYGQPLYSAHTPLQRSTAIPKTSSPNGQFGKNGQSVTDEPYLLQKSPKKIKSPHRAKLPRTTNSMSFFWSGYLAKTSDLESKHIKAHADMLFSLAYMFSTVSVAFHASEKSLMLQVEADLARTPSLHEKLSAIQNHLSKLEFVTRNWSISPKAYILYGDIESGLLEMSWYYKKLAQNYFSISLSSISIDTVKQHYDRAISLIEAYRANRSHEKQLGVTDSSYWCKEQPSLLCEAVYKASLFSVKHDPPGITLKIAEKIRDAPLLSLSGAHYQIETEEIISSLSSSI